MPTPPVWWTFDTPGYHKYSVALKANSNETLKLEHSGWISVAPAQPHTNSERFSIFGPNVLSSGQNGIWEVIGSAGKASRLAVTVTFTPFSGGAPVIRIASQNVTSGECIIANLFHMQNIINIYIFF